MPSAFNDDVQFGLQVSRPTNLSPGLRGQGVGGKPFFFFFFFFWGGGVVIFVFWLLGVC